VKDKELLLSIWDAYTQVEYQKYSIDRIFQLKEAEFIKEMHLLVEGKPSTVPMQAYYQYDVALSLQRNCRTTSEIIQNKLSELKSSNYYATKKHDAKSVYLQNLSSVNTVESSRGFKSIQDEKVFVRMFHNEENVKVQIVVLDKSMQTKFLMQGLKVFVDTSGKKSKKYCIAFPKCEREQMLRMESANHAELVNGRNKTTLDAEKANIQMANDGLLITVNMPLSLLGNKVGKNKIISVGLSAEMDAHPSGSIGSDGGGSDPTGEEMDRNTLSEMISPFNAWITFGLE